MKKILFLLTILTLTSSRAHAGQLNLDKMSNVLSQEEEQILENLPQSNTNVCDAIMPNGEKVVDLIRSKSPEIAERFPLPDCKRSLKETINYYLGYAGTWFHQGLDKIKFLLQTYIDKICNATSLC